MLQPEKPNLCPLKEWREGKGTNAMGTFTGKPEVAVFIF